MSSAKKIKRNMQDHGIEEFEYDGGELVVTPEMKAAYEWDGAIMVRKLLSNAEVEKITSSVEKNKAFMEKAFEVADGTGTSSRLVLWNHPGNDLTGMVGRVEKVAKTAQQLLGGEVYHYHTKFVMKNPRTGGKHLWHQDYGYWYQNGVLRPDLLTAYIALDPCIKANGCLQVVPGTQRCGRIEHVLAHGQTQADQDRVDELLKYFPKLYVEMQPGDALFFHCNLLHTSDKNLSDQRRWTFLCCYNRADNDPVTEHHHAQYTPLAMVPNTGIMDCKNLKDLTGKDFVLPSRDKTIRGTVVDSKN